MVVTGYRLRHAIKRLEQRRNVAVRQFKDSMYVFEGERKPSPADCMAQFRACEEKMAALQVAQATYNLAVVVEVLGRTMTLHEAVKRVGGAGRAEKLWREVADEEHGYGYYSNVRARSTDQEYAERVIPVNECLDRADEAAQLANALREAIAMGNAQELEIAGLEPSLFE